MAKKTWKKCAAKAHTLSKAPRVVSEVETGPSREDEGRAWFESLDNPDICLISPPEAHAEYFRSLLLDELSERLKKRTNTCLQQVLMFLWSVEHDRGCTTPAEEFVTDIASDHYRYGLTPEMARDRLGVPNDPKDTDGFEYNFKDAVEAAQIMLARYPNLFPNEAEAPKMRSDVA